MNNPAQITLRLPRRVRNRVCQSAAHHSRSMNSEIVARLEASFRRDETNSMLRKILDRLDGRA